MVVNFMLFFIILGVLISGILISIHVFVFLNIETTSFVRQFHLFLDVWGFALIGVHLGLHFQMILGKRFRKLASFRWKYLVYLL